MERLDATTYRCRVCGAIVKARAGFGPPLWHLATSSGEPMHRVVQLSRFLGLAEPAPPGLWFGQRQVSAAKQAIPPGAPVLAIGPTANWAGKQWPAAKFADLVLRLIAPRAIFAGARVAVFGAESLVFLFF